MSGTIELAVLEGRWSRRRNTSVRCLFDLLSDLRHGHPHGYHYETFCNADALEKIILGVGAQPELKFVYIGGHGVPDAICGTLGDEDGRVSRTRLRNSIQKLNASGKYVYGLYLGTCFFGTRDNAEFLLGNGRHGEQASSLEWVAGYSCKVDWVDSAIVDLHFTRTLLKAQGTPSERAEKAARKVTRDLLPMAQRLGFQVYARDGDDCRMLIPAKGERA